MERSNTKQHSEEVQYSTNRGTQTVDQGCQKSLRFIMPYFPAGGILNTITIKKKLLVHFGTTQLKNNLDFTKIRENL
jgi:hypothetical protein